VNGSAAALLEAARRALREAVLPELHSDHARSQLAGAMDILAKLERMTEWTPAILRGEADALARGTAAFEARAAALGLQPPRATAEDDCLETRRAHARALSDWLYDAVTDRIARAELDALLRASLREAVAAERRHVPRTDFSSMTGSRED